MQFLAIWSHFLYKLVRPLALNAQLSEWSHREPYLSLFIDLRRVAAVCGFDRRIELIGDTNLTRVVLIVKYYWNYQYFIFIISHHDLPRLPNIIPLTFPHTLVIISIYHNTRGHPTNSTKLTVTDFVLAFPFNIFVVCDNRIVFWQILSAIYKRST